MNKINNKVFWLTRGNYEIPESEEWENVQCVIVNCLNLSFENTVEYILKMFSETKPNKYALITDTDDKEELELLNSKFISNNIIKIGVKSYNKEKTAKRIEWVMSDFGMNQKTNGNVWFISDTHFNHSNIIKYCIRPWNSGEDSNGDIIVTEDDVLRMNEEIIKNWNSVVGKDDIVWHLGDFCLGKNQNENIHNIVSRLNGKINLVMGNHDHHSVDFYYKAGFNRVYDRPVIINDFFILSHAPIQWIKDGSVYANLYGHVHNQEMYRNCTSNTYNCCVEVNEYKPISFSQIKERLQSYENK